MNTTILLLVIVGLLIKIDWRLIRQENDNTPLGISYGQATFYFLLFIIILLTVGLVC